jgi:hypothetical protein
MSDTGEILGNAMGMAATGVGLGIMTMGAMVPLVVMKNTLGKGGIGNIKSKKGSNINIKLPKVNYKINTSQLVKPIKIKKIRIK